MVILMAFIHQDYAITGIELRFQWYPTFMHSLHIDCFRAILKNRALLKKRKQLKRLKTVILTVDTSKAVQLMNLQQISLKMEYSISQTLENLWCQSQTDFISSQKVIEKKCSKYARVYIDPMPIVFHTQNLKNFDIYYWDLDYH